jgi:hypothetical protein
MHVGSEAQLVRQHSAPPRQWPSKVVSRRTIFTKAASSPGSSNIGTRAPPARERYQQHATASAAASVGGVRSSAINPTSNARACPSAINRIFPSSSASLHMSRNVRKAGT